MKLIQFFIQSKKHDQEASIYIRMRMGRQLDMRIRTNLIVPVNKWNSEQGSIKNAKTAEMKELMVTMSNLKLRIEEAYLQADRNNIRVDKQWLMNVVSPQKTVEDNSLPITLVEYFDYYISIKRSSAAKQSVKKWSSVRQKIKAFEKSQKRVVLLKEVNEKFRIDFEDFCKRKQKLSANYFERVLTFIKTICKHAAQNNIDISPQLHGLKAKKEAVHKIFLTREEIERLHVAHMPNEELENSKDWLVISCNTAQRISDFMHFQKSDLIELFDGNKAIQAIKIKQQKTGKLLEIPVFKMVKEILDKRNGEFPLSISDQRYNTNIKKICALVGIDEVVFGSKMDKKTKRLVKGYFPKYELVSSHIGRRSFATCQYGHLPNTHIMAYTGHSTEKQLLAYIGKPQAEVSKLSIQTLINNGWI
ncbi:MAG: phage integrase SAM-like domain-containing protein [Flavobacteriales bacterium]